MTHAESTEQLDRFTAQRIRVLARRAGTLDADMLAFLRLRENSRTVQWLADAGVIDCNDGITAYELRLCRQAVPQIPSAEHVRIGETHFAQKLRAPFSLRGSVPHCSKPRSLPPPLPARYRGKK